MPPSVILNVPLSVGRYQMTGRMDAGIPGAHRARDPDTGVPVTVYLYPVDAAAARRAEHAMAAPEHPNILRVLDAGREGNFYYLATEWVEGTTLLHRIENHARLPEVDVIRFLAQIGQAMDFIRTGDESPLHLTSDRVLIRNDGVAKIIPFELPGGEVASEADIGKPVPFADVLLAMGVTLHEALTGRRWTPPSSSKRRHRPTPRPAGLTDRAERAIRRATDPDPGKRPASCVEFLKHLRNRSTSAGVVKQDRRPGGQASDNRRGFVRYSLGLGANCSIHSSVFADGPLSTEVWPLVVQDLSAGGIGILLARRCEPGTELSVEMTGDTGRRLCSLPVTVVNVRKELHGHWSHGCAFLTPLADGELLSLLNHLVHPESA